MSLARKAAIGALLDVGGSASMRVQLDDVTAGVTSTVASSSISAAESSFVTHALTLDPSLLKPAHAYRLLLTTDLSAAALLSNIRVSYDDIDLTATTAAAGSSGGGSTGGGSTGGGSSGGGSTGGGSTGGGAGAGPAVRLTAPRTVRFRRGHALTLRVRALRSGKAVRHLAVTVRIGTSTRHVSTGIKGFASIRLVLRGRPPVRITFRAGTASATTWARLRRASA